MSSEWLSLLARGDDPNIIYRMRSGWAVLGDTQHLPGYSILVQAGNADHLTDLPRAERTAFLLDLSLLGEAVGKVCAENDAGFLRINYEILGNSWQNLHGHVRARYSWEVEELRVGPVYLYGDERKKKEYALGPVHAPLRAQLAAALASITADAYRNDDSSG